MRRTLNPTTGAGGGQGDPPVLDAIAAYDRIASGYSEISRKRRAYLDAVDEEILRRMPVGASSLIDVGAGDGRRGLRIAERAGIVRVVLVEPSTRMRELIPAGVEVRRARMETLPDSPSEFDIVLCLWNVLGHVPSRELRVAGLRKLGGLCSRGGLIFLDVLNRYNVAECGIGVVLRRFMSPLQDGDVAVKWRTGAGEVKTQGHVFTGREMEGLFRDAELTLIERTVLNYCTGRPETQAMKGNFFYVLRGSASEDCR